MNQFYIIGNYQKSKINDFKTILKNLDISTQYNPTSKEENVTGKDPNLGPITTGISYSPLYKWGEINPLIKHLSTIIKNLEW